MTANELFKDFPPVSEAAWKLQIQADLRGGDYNELLTTTTPEGIRIKPFYTAADLPEGMADPLATTRGTPVSATPWQVGFLLDGAESSNPASRAREALDGGVDRLLIRLGSKNGWIHSLAGEAGRQQSAESTDPAAMPQLSGTWFELADPHVDLARLFPNGLPEQSLFLADPIGELAATGNWPRKMGEDFRRLVELGADAAIPATACVRADHYQQAGADCVLELACALAHMHEYLLRAGDQPVLEPMLANPVFRVAIGGDYFMEIAKLRALRSLWALLANDAGLSGDCRIVAVPSLRCTTLYDYNTNMLRSTLACMAAVAGGADLACNLPYDFLYNTPNSFADRIARNQLVIMREEAYMDKVANPADGSYYVEYLSDQLGTRALERFKRIEKQGGLLKQLKSHQLQKQIREQAARAQAAFDVGDSVLVGSNAYPNPEDRMAGILEKDPFARATRKTLLEPLVVRRLAAKYERERLKQEREALTQERAKDEPR